MRFLVSTLYCGENEFSQCRRSLRNQTHDCFEHRVFRDLGHREAHRELYSSFMECKGRYDALVKLDADMVLQSNTFLTDLEDFLRDRKDVQDLEIAVHDFFTDRMVWGLHVYRAGVQWEFDEEGLFVDRSPVSSRHHYYDAAELAPAATHCANPSAKQCLMYGLKRGLKAVQWPREEQPDSMIQLIGSWLWEKLLQAVGTTESEPEPTVHAKVLSSHWEGYRELKKRAAAVRDPRLKWALLGYEFGMSEEFRESDLNYQSDFFRTVFAEVRQESPRAIQERIRELRRRNGGFLPQFLRRKWLRARHFLTVDL